MKCLWYRELARYSKEKIQNDLGVNSARIINKLIGSRILWRVKRGNGEASDEDMLSIDSMNNSMLTFKFCGIVMIEDILIRCYPKYIQNHDYKKSFPLVLNAIKKYKTQKRQRNYLLKRGTDDKDFFSIVLALIKDYQKNGLYWHRKRDYEYNGEGETDWQDTLERYNPVFLHTSKGMRPAYINRITYRQRTDEENFFRQIHMAVLDECSNIIRKMELTELIAIRGIRFLENKLQKLGSTRYILYKLKKEYSCQFLEKRRNILRLLIIYIEKKYVKTAYNDVVFWGTNSLHVIWEEASKQIFENQLYTKVKDIDGLQLDLRKKYEKRNEPLINVIDSPEWLLIGSKKAIKTPTLIPDVVRITQNSFIIYDAKYYVPHFTDEKIWGQPGLESVAKQFLYHIAYKDFIKYFQVQTVKNIFLIPHSSNGERTFWKLADVDFKILSQYTNNKIEVFYIDAEFVWRMYIQHHHL